MRISYCRVTRDVGAQSCLRVYTGITLFSLCKSEGCSAGNSEVALSYGSWRQKNVPRSNMLRHIKWTTHKPKATDKETERTPFRGRLFRPTWSNQITPLTQLISHDCLLRLLAAVQDLRWRIFPAPATMRGPYASDAEDWIGNLLHMETCVLSLSTMSTPATVASRYGIFAQRTSSSV